ncbi:DUF6509 family protein [Gorillibacterium sp. sgz5001074]|uniref:DUF6509 family protein n=1 Tax=Gorillibacterium sp. sgz5001074 TaxID=3446695 RepID=UPI003F66FDEF
MFAITAYSVEWVKDPFGIIPGKRYEFNLDIEPDEEDELFSEGGIALRVIYGVEESKQGIVKYEFQEKDTGKYLDFEMEAGEAEAVDAFCREHVGEAEE